MAPSNQRPANHRHSELSYAVVATLSIAGTPTGGLFTLSRDSGTGTEVSFASNSLVSVAPGDLVVSSISGKGYSAYERIYSNGTFLGTDYFTTGIAGPPYTSKAVLDGTNGKPESASFSNGMTETWTYNPDGSYQTAYADVTGAPYTSKTVQYGTNGKAESASFGNGMTETWTYNPDGSYQIAYADMTGAPYTSETVQYGANGKAESASFSNGMTEAWTYNPDGSYQTAYAGVTGAHYTSETDAIWGQRQAGERLVQQRHDGDMDLQSGRLVSGGVCRRDGSKLHVRDDPICGRRQG